MKVLSDPVLRVFYIVFISVFLLNACGGKKNTSKHVLRSPEKEVKASEPTNPSKIARLDTVKRARSEQPVEKKKEEPIIVPPLRVELPEVDREFRAAWVATVANINWPSSPSLTTDQQKHEALALLNFLEKNNFNAVIFQVRPAADALYASKYEPWSYYLTGEIGKRPEPYYDPLEFWVEEAHKRGLELHVWLNPYRAHHSSRITVTPQSMVKKEADLVVRLKNGSYWFDPGNPKTQDHASNVVMDIVKRYDIDGVHFDDYFYPYASYNGGADFPDYASWQAYKRKGGQLSRADWRRENVNSFIKRVYEGIKAEKNHVKFGLSPFGIWKPGYPSGITGSSQYDELYADAKLWLNKGWVDYFAPQLYWPIHPARQSFTALLQWWSNENTHKRHLWPGINTVRNKNLEHSAEIVRQIEATRKIVPESKGVVHWSISGLTKNPHMTNAVYQNVYSKKALVPRTPWLNANPLLRPTLLLTKQENIIFTKWLHKQPHEVFQWILYYQYGEEWGYEILKGTQTEKELPLQKNGKHLRTVAIKALDRLSNESNYEAKRVPYPG